MMKKAVVFGATGLVGGCLLRQLIADSSFGEVVCFVRRAQTLEVKKVTFIVTDFSDLARYQDNLSGAIVFCCVGTTIKQVNYVKEDFKKADLYLPLEIARLAVANNASQLFVISALGANRHSMIFYNRVKGELEFQLKQIEMHSLHIIQPSFLTGHRNERRIGERTAKFIMALLSPILIGGLRKYKSISGDEVAAAMLSIAGQELNGTFTWTSDQLKALASSMPIPS